MFANQNFMSIAYLVLKLLQNKVHVGGSGDGVWGCGWYQPPQAARSVNFNQVVNEASCFCMNRRVYTFL